ncbi:hypothetical protein AGDE_12236 [Angomonas deanei]|uniref:Radial spokehead-like protein, putative n=1 Tax=Angomonas deanei TaxID=59799 RepID=A0A7G2CUB2_9TRYP|nr:hypothetical protein AGDE_12236 [Angomonas deanei]CAD2222063.1 Radial spokehead-like protein, putative [Angomonas deanei]|eukprot:EPY24659.1 hypothetical protein AGDE_12236 [Angomonas deanei]
MSKYLNLIGRSLHVSEITALECSLPLLSERYGAPATFWGKITGLKRDYLIAQIQTGDVFSPCVSFASVDGGHTWKLLEEITEDQAQLCDELRGVYYGDLTFEYKVRRDIPEPPPEPEVALPEANAVLAQAKADLKNRVDNDDDEEDEEEKEEEEEEEEEEQPLPKRKKNKPKFVIVSVTENVRLHHFIRLHDACCRLAVRGEYVLQGGAVGERNRLFVGQPLHHALKPSCYVKVAHLGKRERNAKLYGPTYNEHTDYLRPITDDAPVGVWLVKYDASQGVVGVQNLLYEGSLFWYVPGTVQHGQVYYGNGERNFDLCFTL